MEKGFFHPASGYWQTLDNPSDEIISQYPEGTIEVPIRPSVLHKWNSGQWIAPTQEEVKELLAAQIRSERDLRLAQDVDPVVTNPLRWGSFSDKKQAEWAAYRQALLDITKQIEFPIHVVWPTQPE